MVTAMVSASARPTAATTIITATTATQFTGTGSDHNRSQIGRRTRPRSSPMQLQMMKLPRKLAARRSIDPNP